MVIEKKFLIISLSLEILLVLKVISDISGFTKYINKYITGLTINNGSVTTKEIDVIIDFDMAEVYEVN